MARRQGRRRQRWKHTIGMKIKKGVQEVEAEREEEAQTEAQEVDEE